MGSRAVKLAAVASGGLLMLAAPVLAAEVPSSTDVSAEATGTADGQQAAAEPRETSAEPVDEVLDQVDEAVGTVGDAADDAAGGAPEPVGSTVDGTTDTVTTTTDRTTDAIAAALGGPGRPAPPNGGAPQEGAGSGPVPAPAPPSSSAATSSPARGGSVVAGSVPVRVPARIALDGFRRIGGPSGVEAGPGSSLFYPDPAFAPPTTRRVIEPGATSPVPLRDVALEILLATGLLVLATGGLVVELGPGRA